MGQIIRTYIDSGVFIEAWRGSEPTRSLARQLLASPWHQFVSSRLLVLEVIPKASYHRKLAEIAFYSSLLGLIQEWIPLDESVVDLAIDLGGTYDVVGIDALHVAAALAAQVDQFITCEKPTKPMFRVDALRAVNLEAIVLGP